jgi:hypothetical protein
MTITGLGGMQLHLLRFWGLNPSRYMFDKLSEMWGAYAIGPSRTFGNRGRALQTLG